MERSLKKEGNFCLKMINDKNKMCIYKEKHVMISSHSLQFGLTLLGFVEKGRFAQSFAFVLKGFNSRENQTF